jgi:hypothetical protein
VASTVTSVSKGSGATGGAGGGVGRGGRGFPVEEPVTNPLAFFSDVVVRDSSFR